MRTAGIALTLFAALLFVPSAVQRIKHRLRVAAADETPTRDRLVLEAMERQFENGGGS